MNDELDRLVAAAKRADHPSPGATERAWDALAAAMIAGATPSVPVDLGTTVAASGVGLKSLVIVGVTIVTAATTAIVAGAIESRTREPVAVVRSAAAERSVDSLPPPAILPAVPEPIGSPPAVVESSPSASPEVAGRSVRRVPDVAAEPTAPLERSTLAEQARLLGDAWRDLDDGELARAVARLQEHAERFPDSPLAPEREAAKIVAWCKQDQPWADAQARRFIAAHEGSARAKRVARACDVDAEKKE